jgi:hypothetical protein
MRDKLNQLKRVRDVRADMRKKEWAHARSEHSDAEAQVQQLIQQKKSFEQEAIETQMAFSSQKGMLTIAQINSLKMSIDYLRSEAEAMIPKIAEAEKIRDEKAQLADEAFRTMRIAQRSVDQLVKVDESLAVEEAKIFERMEEAENERIVFKKRPVISKDV